jgi:hypothetical protein
LTATSQSKRSGHADANEEAPVTSSPASAVARNGTLCRSGHHH